MAISPPGNGLNILTFNPGWSQGAQQLSEFTDVRELQRKLKDRGVSMISEADDNSTGPASFMIVDPDGNTISRGSTRLGDAREVPRYALEVGKGSNVLGNASMGPHQNLHRI